MSTKIKAAEFDRKFDRGEDVDQHVDWSQAARPNRETKRVNVDFPAWIIEGLDREAARIGVTRQALIKFWISEHLNRQTNKPS
tara:strand:- start:556 stop:804 length:249 start_codon:yes stop_codon:yes gene_type:complete